MTKTKTEAEAERSRLIFVYGTLQQGGALNDNMIHSGAQYLGPARILSKDFVMRDLNKYPALQRVESGAGTYISGELWIIPTVGISLIDRCEGCPGFFERTDVTVWLDEDQGTNHRAITYHLPFKGDIKRWLSKCPIVPTGKWDAIEGGPFTDGEEPNGCDDMEDCPECGYWMVGNTCSNCNNYYGSIGNHGYYDDNVSTDAWDESHHDGPDAIDNSIGSLSAAGYTVDAGIFITSDYGEMHGPYDSMENALERLAVVAEENGKSAKCYTIGFRVYENGMSQDDYSNIEKDTIFV